MTPTAQPVDHQMMALLQAHLERAVEKRDELLRLLVDERDRQYMQLFAERDRQREARFRSAELAVAAALVSQEKATNASFLSSEKAIDKAEQAQREYNARSNEFRAQLDDQAKTLMPRSESMVLINGLATKMNDLQTSLDLRADNLKTASDERMDQLNKQIAAINLSLQTTLSVSTFDVRHGELQKQVSDLRESRSLGLGAESQRTVSTSRDQWIAGLLIGGAISFVGVLLAAINVLINAGVLK